MAGSELDLVVTNSQKGVTSCSVSGVIVKTLEWINRELCKGELMIHSSKKLTEKPSSNNKEKVESRASI
jgi:hypothetical protein